MGRRKKMGVWGERTWKQTKADIKRRRKRDKVLKMDISVSAIFSPTRLLAGFKINAANKKGPKAVAAYCSVASRTECTQIARFGRHSGNISYNSSKNPNITNSQLRDMARGTNDAKAGLVRNKDLPGNVLEICMRVKKGKTDAQNAKAAKIRDRALRHKNMPQSRLKIGFFTSSADRVSILNNPSTPGEQLRKFDINNYYEAIAVASHPNAHPDDLAKIKEKWASNPGVGRDFKRALAKNTNLKTENIIELKKEKDVSVLANLAKWVDRSLLDDFFKKRQQEIRLALASRPFLSREDEKYLMKFDELGLKLKLAAHPMLSKESQDKLYKQEKWAHLIAVNLAKNPGLDPVIAQDMLDSGDPKLYQKLAVSGHIKLEEPPLPELVKKDIAKEIAMIAPLPSLQSFGGGRCARCGRPITGKHGAFGDKCRRSH